MNDFLKNEMIELGAEAWPAGMRGRPEGIWVSRPRRRIVILRGLIAIGIVGLSTAAIWLIGAESGFRL